ncbi:site-specific integrase [Nonomuraea sp. NPDC048916]|uniref:site-specific integrase n=1 Tax=Nonomuraea sp. NPDC048916 TaxID=3154232 RepID=UPI0033D16DDA
MTAAEEDKLIARNPCRIKGADNEQTPERPVLTVAQVFELADRMADRRFKALVLLATFASLRWGEAIALRRTGIDLEGRVVRVREQLLELDDGGMRLSPLKSRAARRTVSIPSAIVAALADHLAEFVDVADDAFLFLGKRGGFLRGGNFRRKARWADALKEMGIQGLHFHNLRHTGNTLAAQSGASLADHRIADALSARVKAEQTKREKRDDDGSLRTAPAG